MDQLEERVQRAMAIIDRIELIKSFLPYKEVRKVRNTYKKHTFRKIEKIPNYKDLLYAAINCDGYVQVDNPNGSNYGVSISTIEKIHKNYVTILMRSLTKN